MPSLRCGLCIPCSVWTAASGLLAAGLKLFHSSGSPLCRPARTVAYAYFCWRPETIAAPLARGHGRARERAGAPRQGRGADRLEHGRRGVLALSAPPRRLARAVRDRRPQPDGRPQHASEAGRRSGRPDRRAGRADAVPRRPAHPAFSYRPETGEEIYHAFVGVPILRGGHTIGVLTVQNRTKRQYSDEEVEALQTTAMVLAETIASGGLVTDGLTAGGAPRGCARVSAGVPSPRAWRSAMSCCTSRVSWSRA